MGTYRQCWNKNKIQKHNWDDLQKGWESSIQWFYPKSNSNFGFWIRVVTPRQVKNFTKYRLLRLAFQDREISIPSFPYNPNIKYYSIRHLFNDTVSLETVYYGMRFNHYCFEV